MDYLSGINQFTQVAAQLSVLLLIVRVAFGALNCFMGYRMLKFWISVCGFFLGTGIGMAAVYILQLSGNVKWILPLAAGGITAVLGYEVYLVGAFFLGWVLTTYGILMVVRQLDIEPKMEILLLAAGTLFGVLVGILVVKYAANLTTYLPSVHLWHHDIQNNQSNVFLFKKYIYRLFSVTGFQHIKIFFHQEIFYQFPHSALVIHNQNLQFSHSCSSS